jgi:hypothetical protein
MRKTTIHHKKAPRFQVHLHCGMQSINWIPKLQLVPNSQFYNHCLLYDSRHELEDAHHLTGVKEHTNVAEASRDCLDYIQLWALQQGLWEKS